MSNVTNSRRAVLDLPAYPRPLSLLALSHKHYSPYEHKPADTVDKQWQSVTNLEREKADVVCSTGVVYAAGVAGDYDDLTPTTTTTTTAKACADTEPPAQHNPAGG